jgi:cyclophilin family peptidyl-prolyl cis-trans isomerase
VTYSLENGTLLSKSLSRADSPPILAERLEVLSALGMFKEAVQTAKQLRLPPRLRTLVEILESSAKFWQQEVALRAEDEKRRAERIVLQTTKGEITVELFDGNSADFVLEAARAKKLNATSFEPVTGGVLANLRFEGNVPARTPATPGKRRRHWRGSMGLTQTGPRAELYFTTKRTFWLDDDKHTVIGRVVDGMARVDALEFGDRVESARLTTREVQK